MTRITPTQHAKNEWSRMAQSAYAANLNTIGHTMSAAASLPHDGSLSVDRYDFLCIRSARTWRMVSIT